MAKKSKKYKKTAFLPGAYCHEKKMHHWKNEEELKFGDTEIKIYCIVCGATKKIQLSGN